MLRTTSGIGTEATTPTVLVLVMPGQGNKLIFATSFGYQEFVQKVAADLKDMKPILSFSAGAWAAGAAAGAGAAASSFLPQAPFYPGS